MNKQKVLLVQPNYQLKKDAVIWGMNPPLNLAYIAAVLERSGVQVEILDANVLRLSPKQVADYASDKKFNILGISILTPAHTYCIQVAKLLPKDIISVAGGPHSAGMSEELLKEGFDLVVRGEGEYTMLDIALGKDVKEIKGLSYIKDNIVIHNEKRPPLNPDDLPFPARHLLINNGVDRPYASEGTRFFPWSPIFTARGCPYNCYYCNKLTYGACFAARTPENVVAEMIELVSKYNVKEIDFYDDCFNFDMKRAENILDLIISKKIKIYLRFSNGLRADKISENLLVKMKKAGCDYLAYGIESGSQEVLDKIPKAIKLDTIRKAVALTKKQGITTIGFFMLGLIGDTEETMQKTIDFAKELDLDGALFNIAVPYPVTKMWDMIEKNGRLLISGYEDYCHTSGKMVYEYPGTATPDVVERMFKKANREFYFRPKYILKQLPKLLRPSQIPMLLKGLKRIMFLQRQEKCEKNGAMKNETKKLYENWDNFWSKKEGPTRIGQFLMNLSIDAVKKTLDRNSDNIKHDAKILDIGCGSGRTLNIFRRWGYSNIIGIDNSVESVKRCIDYGFEKDKDVFVMDGTHTSFKDNEFEVVFSEGILEHFLDFSGFAKEMARISSKYILLIQPNHFSFFGKTINFLSDHLRQNVKEYSYKIDDFILAFQKNGYKLKEKRDTPLADFWILLFEKEKGK
ncbi:radical SAM protein [Candidatus Saganbacteria bacterium]|nr:radical SAM protein [Candidatus Saganbacteria bacterium]